MTREFMSDVQNPTCPRCGEPFEAGQRIAVVGGDWLLNEVTVHLECVYEAEGICGAARLLFTWGGGDGGQVSAQA